MDKDELIERLMKTFLGELDDHVAALERDALALERAPEGDDRDAIVANLFRTVHSLKGAARSVELRAIERACHALESLLARARDRSAPADGPLAGILLDAADALGETRDQLRANRPVESASLDRLAFELSSSAGVEMARARHARRPAFARQGEPSEPLAPLEETPIRSDARDVAEAAPGPRPSRDDSAAPAPSAPAASVRIETEKLDALLARSGELLVAGRAIDALGADIDEARESIGQLTAAFRSAETARLASERAHAMSAVAWKATERIKEAVATLDVLADRIAAAHRSRSHTLRIAINELDEEVRRARLFLFGDGVDHLQRAARSLALELGKEVDLVVRGRDVKVDRTVLERLRDPLLHLVRNAVDHGVERADERRSAGKPERATIVVSAELRGSQVEVRVSDDGRGLDATAIRASARARGLELPADEAGLARLVFTSGFSTAQSVTEVSGRGIGLDVVAERVESLHGSVDVASRRGTGTTFVLTVPLTITTIRVLVVEIARQPIAIPTTSVRAILSPRGEEVHDVDGRSHVVLAGASGRELVPVYALADVLGATPAVPRDDEARRRAVVVLSSGGRRVGFHVDALLAEQEAVVKSLGDRLRLRYYSGATIGEEGTVSLILNSAEVARAALEIAPRATTAPDPRQAGRAAKRIVVVDDSVTTRTLVESILEGAGYEVLVAADGAEAYALLERRGADLVVSDVEMPRMDGFELTARIRSSVRFRALPVVLVTALESERDRMRGAEVGANAYIGKSVFDQRELLEVVGQLV